jgi:hypothetical protein
LVSGEEAELPPSDRAESLVDRHARNQSKGV